jgi:hypothetical protein
VWQEISGGQDEIDLGRRKIASRVLRAVQFPRARPAERSGNYPAASVTASIAKMLKEGANLLLLTNRPTISMSTPARARGGALEYRAAPSSRTIAGF